MEIVERTDLLLGKKTVCNAFFKKVCITNVLEGRHWVGKWRRQRLIFEVSCDESFSEHNIDG